MAKGGREGREPWFEGLQKVNKVHSVTFMITRQALTVGLVAFAGCSSSLPVSDHCFVVLGSLSPSPAPVKVGDTLSLAVKINAPECMPSDSLASQRRWAISDTTVAVTDSLTGLLTGRKAGTAQVVLSTSVTHTPLGWDQVQVSP